MLQMLSEHSAGTTYDFVDHLLQHTIRCNSSTLSIYMFDKDLTIVIMHFLMPSDQCNILSNITTKSFSNTWIYITA